VPGHQLLRRVGKNRVPDVVRYSASGSSQAILMIPAVWNYFVGYAVGHRDRGDGLYIAFVIPVYLRWRKGDSWDEPRRGASASTTSGSTRSRSLGRLITIIFLIPLYKVGLPGRTASTGRFTNYTILWFAGIGSSSAAGGALGEHWFKGPVRMGTEEELERMEEEQLGQFGLPTEDASARCSRSGGAPLGAPPRFTPRAPPRTRRLGRPRSRSKCSLAYATKSKSSSETADWTTPHIASRKSDMKRMRRGSARPVPQLRRSRRRAASRSRPRRARG
jgi:hypothetical protein